MALARRAAARPCAARRPRRRHGRRSVRCAGHHQYTQGRDGVKLTFLGTGTSFGVPQLGCHCQVCRSADPRDKRTRVGAVVESAGRDAPAHRHPARTAAAVDRRRHRSRGRRAVHARPRRPQRTASTTSARSPCAATARCRSTAREQTLASLRATFRVHLRRERPAAARHVEAGGARHRLHARPSRSPWRHRGAAVRGAPWPDRPCSAYRIGDLAYVTDAKSIPHDAMAHDRRRAGPRRQRALPHGASDAPLHPRGARAARGASAPNAPISPSHARQLSRRPRGRTCRAASAPAFDGLMVRID